MDEKIFRQCLGHFATGVSVITSSSGTNNVGVTINSLTSLSLDPPLILFCLENIAHSLPAFLNNQYFTINILSKGQEDISKHFANRSLTDKWSGVEFSISTLTKNPVLPNILCLLECERESVYLGGDHKIIVGRVIHGKNYDKEPLIYYRGGYVK